MLQEGGDAEEHGAAAAFGCKGSALLVAALKSLRVQPCRGVQLWECANQQLCAYNAATHARRTKIRLRQKQKINYLRFSVRSTGSNSSLAPLHPEMQRVCMVAALFVTISR